MAKVLWVITSLAMVFLYTPTLFASIMTLAHTLPPERSGDFLVKLFRMRLWLGIFNPLVYAGCAYAYHRAKEAQQPRNALFASLAAFGYAFFTIM